MLREKRTYSGPLLEVEFYPVFKNGQSVPAMPHKNAEAQKNYNRRKAQKKLIRLVNANFDESDYFLHPTYDPAFAPGNREEAKRDIKNYIRRVKRAREKELERAKSEKKLLPENAESLQEFLTEKIKKLSSPLRYIYIIETQTYKSGENAGRKNYHFHIFISGGLSDRKMESLWNMGVRVNCLNFQPERFGPEAAARYVSKQEPESENEKRFICSQNLKQPFTPDPSKRDGKTSERRLEKWANERTDDKSFWEKKYPGYRFLYLDTQINPYNGRRYLSVTMYKIHGRTDMKRRW